MRVLHVAIMGAAAPGLMIVGVLAYAAWNQAHLQYPSPENESAFLRGYDSKTVIQPFTALEGFSEGRESGGGAGTKFVTHTGGFDERFTIRSDQKESLMEALSDDISRRLLLSGARIFHEYGTPSSGFHCDYATGKTIGSISIRPLTPGRIRRNMPLPSGLEDVDLNIEIREEWFPKGIQSEMAEVAYELTK